MKTSTKIKWTNVPVNAPDTSVTYLKGKLIEAFDALSNQATLVKQEIDSGRIDRAKNRLTLVEEYIEEFKEEINI
tara:strand:- start:559 stop:783 length:225 start_codon:yes stop_codon:yes gene_type:complete